MVNGCGAVVDELALPFCAFEDFNSSFLVGESAVIAKNFAGRSAGTG
jgi:hypothetical protein